MAKPSADQGAPKQESTAERARRLLDQASASQEAARPSEAQRAWRQTQAHMRDLTHMFSRAAQTGRWLYQHVLEPVGSLTPSVVKTVGYGYQRLWNRVCYGTDANGDRRLLKKRAGAMVLATALAVWYAPTILGTASSFLWHAGLYITTARHRILYLHGSEEPTSRQYAAKGCETLPCNDQNTLYFRIYDTLFHDIRHLVVYQSGFYPDFVAAAIPPGLNRCDVVDYSFRQKLFTRYLELDPILLEAECVPVDAKGQRLKPSEPGSQPIEKNP